MQENYLISIVGTQEIDGEKDQIELTTVGTYVPQRKTADTSFITSLIRIYPPGRSPPS